MPNPGRSGAAAVLISQEGNIIDVVSRFLGDGTNNTAEYHGLLIWFELAKRHLIDDLEIFTDSQLVASQMNGNWKAKHPKIIPLREQARAESSGFRNFKITWIPREQNTIADRYANRSIVKLV